MDKLEDLLKVIEVNCKNQFGLHCYWFLAKVALTAFNNGKLGMAKSLNDRLYKRTIMDKEVADATLTFNKFTHNMNDAIKAQSN